MRSESPRSTKEIDTRCSFGTPATFHFTDEYPVRAGIDKSPTDLLCQTDIRTSCLPACVHIEIYIIPVIRFTIRVPVAAAALHHSPTHVVWPRDDLVIEESLYADYYDT